jgi:hypothetical protein
MNKKALLLLGCPELPVQTSCSLYLASKLKAVGIDVFVAGTDAALNLLKVSDPGGYYVDEARMTNLDNCIEALIEQRIDFDWCFVFVHNDAGLSYLATLRSIARAELFAIVFGEDARSLAEQIDFRCEKLIAETAHNPLPLKKVMDKRMKEVKLWAASN